MNSRKQVPTLKPGEQYNRWTVLRPEKQGRRSLYVVQCICGKEATVPAGHLVSGRSKSCGCLRIETATAHRIARCPVGHVFGRLTVLGDSSEGVTRRAYWRCMCSCGKQVTSCAYSIKKGAIISCGCASAERIGSLRRTHNKRHTPEYDAWCNMRRRCNEVSNAYYKDYGGRGIRVCSAWQNSFVQFLADVGERPSAQHSLDRIIVDGNYEPGNVRWATAREQVANRRNTFNPTKGGVTRSIEEWCEELHMNYGDVKHKIALGLTPYEAVFLGYPRTRKRRELLNWEGCNDKKSTAA